MILNQHGDFTGEIEMWINYHLKPMIARFQAIKDILNAFR